MSQRDNDLIEHILDAAGKLAEIVAAGRENFDASWMVRSAAERQLEIIGEAAGKLSEQLHERRPTLPISEARAMRNVIAHEYGDVDYDLLWHTMSASIPQFAASLGGWCQMGVWCAGVGGGGAGAVSGRVLWCGGVCWGLSGRCWAGVGRSGAQPRAHRCCVECSPSTPRRAMLAAAASRLKSASTLARPRTRAWRPPCFRRTRCASLRSTLGRTAR